MNYRLPKSKKVPYLLAVLFSTFIWAAATPIIKITLDTVPPMTFLLFRLTIVCVILLPYTITMLRRIPIYKDDLIKIIILGVASQSSLVLIFFGLRFTTAMDGVIISLLGPILSVLAGHYFYHEKIDWHVKAGLWLATLGTVFVTLEPLMNPSEFSTTTELRLVGNILIALSSLSFLLYVIWSKIIDGQSTKEIKRTLGLIHMKPMHHKYPTIFVSVISFYIGLATFIPMAIIESTGFFGDFYFNFQALTLTPILGILFMAIFSSIIAYTLFEWSLKEVEVKDTAILSYLSPLMTFPFAYAILGEVPNAYMLTGGALIAIGVVIAEIKKS